MVHDSYGTHAGSVEIMNRVLRETFVEQYNHDVLKNFREEVCRQIPSDLAAKIPPCPPKGSLDLGAVINSQYFFS
jgi:DNA-directed RNA polymerase